MFPDLQKEQAQQKAYRSLPDADLFETQPVQVEIRPEDLPGCKAARIICEKCGEGVNFNRQVVASGRTLCRACAGSRYYEPLA